MTPMSFARLAASGLLALATAPGHAQIHRCTAADGRVTYSDRPCPNAPTASPPVAADVAGLKQQGRGRLTWNKNPEAFRDLLGTWSVATVKRDGVAKVDRDSVNSVWTWDLVNSVWTFRGDALYIKTPKPNSPMRSFAVEVDLTKEPKVFHVTTSSPKDKDGWMLFSRADDALRIAFYDDLARRPSSFDSKDGLIVLQLERPTSPSLAANPRCNVLREAGAFEVLGKGKHQGNSEKYPHGGFECRIERENSVYLTVTPGRNDQFEARIKQARRDTKYRFQEERDSAVPAYSLTSEPYITFVAFKQGKMVQLNFIVYSKPDSAQLRQIFARVLANV